MSVYRDQQPHVSFEHEVHSRMLEPTEWLDTQPSLLEDLVEEVIERAPVKRAFDGIETRELSDMKLFTYYFG